MKLQFVELIVCIVKLTSYYSSKISEVLAESEQSHTKMIEDSGWTPQEYFETLNKHKSEFYKNF